MYGRVWNPAGRFTAPTIEWDEAPPPAGLALLPDDSQSVLSSNDSPDVPFRFTVNPYRGCTHACAYCYARPTHEYLGLGAGSDFERRIFVKHGAPALLEAAFRRPDWAGEAIVFSGVTDCYQPIERRLGLTGACVALCAAYRNPIGIITRSPLVVRDLPALQRLAAHGAVTVSVSLPVFDPATARALEPGAPPPSARLKAMAALAAAGVPVGVSVAPVIPGVTDHELPRTLAAAREAGAQFAWMSLLRLPGSVAEVFRARLEDALPGRAAAVLAKIRRMRGGALTEGRFGARMRGEGPAWAAVEALFQLHHRRLGFGPRPPPPQPSPFRVPGGGVQLALFGGSSG